jgi:hypothetical protein
MNDYKKGVKIQIPFQKQTLLNMKFSINTPVLAVAATFICDSLVAAHPSMVDSKNDVATITDPAIDVAARSALEHLMRRQIEDQKAGKKDKKKKKEEAKPCEQADFEAKKCIVKKEKGQKGQKGEPKPCEQADFDAKKCVVKKEKKEKKSKPKAAKNGK